MCILVGGLLSVYLHGRYDHPWVDDPVLAAFLLSNGDVMDKEKWDQIDAWEVKGDDMPEGFVQQSGKGMTVVAISIWKYNSAHLVGIDLDRITGYYWPINAIAFKCRSRAGYPRTLIAHLSRLQWQSLFLFISHPF
jgi:hypothetical protein